MKTYHPRTVAARGLPLAALWLASAALAVFAVPALAGDVVARAGQNPNFVQDSNPGATAQAQWPAGAGPAAASATTTRLSTAVEITGAGASASLHHNAASSHGTLYRLWDLDTDTAVDPALARTAALDFNFRLTGATFVDALSLSTMTFQYSATVVSSTAEQASGSVSGVFGPTGYLFIGDTSLSGAFDQTFSLHHSHRDTGQLLMLTSGLAGNAAGSMGQLTLASVTLAAPWTGGSLGLRLEETGQILSVSAVPEPGSWAMTLAGLGLVGWMARRRQV